MRVLDTAQMREADRQTIDDLGLPSIVLMENAGRQVVAALEANYEDLLNRRIAVLCGRGNNGGDGFVVARTLAQRGVDVSVFVLGPVANVTGDARLNLDILGRLGVDAVEVADEQAWELHSSEVGGCGARHRRDRRHRTQAAAGRPARNGGRRPQHAGGAGRVDRPAERPLRRHGARRRPRRAGGDDGDAGVAQDPAGAAARPKTTPATW